MSYTIRTVLQLGLLVSAAMAAQTSLAQSALATVTGTLFDPNHNVLTGFSNAFAHLKSETGSEFTAPLLLTGEFKITGVPAGVYVLSVPLTGAMYRSSEPKSVVVKAGETLHLEVPIEWAINLGTIGDDPNMLAKDMEHKAKNVAGPTPRTPEGTPDLTGMWVPVTEARAPNPFLLQPWAAEIQKKLQTRSTYTQGPAAYCLPQSAIQIALPFPFKLIQTPTLVLHITEFLTPGYRQIFMDGRDHPKDWNPAWQGHSTAKWDGDTLVVDNAGYNASAAGVGVHTEKLHIVERIRRPDKAHLEIDITAEDPDAFTGPWKTAVHAALVPDEEVLEFVCAENNKDPLHFGGLGYTARP